MGVRRTGLVEIIRKYESRISGWISEPDKGMYDAIRKGFERTTGEMMGWLNATDMLHVGGFQVVASVFRDLPSVECITGRPMAFSGARDDRAGAGYEAMVAVPVSGGCESKHSAGVDVLETQPVGLRWGFCRYVVSRGRGLRIVVRFFRHAAIHSVDTAIVGWRLHEEGLGRGNMDLYLQGAKVLSRKSWITSSMEDGCEYCGESAEVKPIPVVRGVWRLLVTDTLDHRRGPDWPQVIEYQWGKVCKWGFRRG